jgi:antitoxin (DNA-binding transcriptional repressor) of toxin-antitoxin stability system
MKTLDLADVSRLPEELKAGEEIALRDGERTVATVTPVPKQTIEERFDELARQGKVRKGTGQLPAWFFEERPPKFPSSVLEQLLHDRYSRDW